ncbi:TPA: dihydroorotate dehydrogenase electron transfer subunit [bacterium]|nr:dihydroorotate dehydrogenase electron transfer subunit [bacterium]
MILSQIKVLDHQEITPSYHRMVLESPAIARGAQPGQFLHIRISDRHEPFLRRPFSIHRVRREKEGQGEIEILYEVVGRGTEFLSKRQQGEYLDILGPLGNGFRIGSEGRRIEKGALLIGGGIGVAPLVFLCEELITNHQLPVTVLLGAKSQDNLLCEEDFRKLGALIKIATEDGSCGHHGLVTDLLPTVSPPSSPIYTCGPYPMLKAIARATQEYHLSCQVSLEAHMACGVGACLGCGLKTRQGYKYVCKDGPVFDACEVIWDD